MNFKGFVCPYDPGLLDRLSGRAVAVRVDDIEQVGDAARDASRSGNRLLCVIVESPSAMDAVRPREEWQGVPLVLLCPAIGQFRKLAGRLDSWRKLNLRVFLPCGSENLAGLRILASVGIPCGVTFGRKEPDWEALSDLMTYAILGPAPHAPIEPFDFIARHYRPDAHTKWDSVYFDDPNQFLHLDSRGRVALSRHELLNGEFLSEEIETIEATGEVPAVADRSDGWRRMFLDNHPCSACGGWRLCLGRFARTAPPPAGCSGFFAELMEVVEQFQGKNAGQRGPDL